MEKWHTNEKVFHAEFFFFYPLKKCTEKHSCENWNAKAGDKNGWN